MKKLAAILIVLGIAVAGVYLLPRQHAPTSEAPSLTVYCAAGLKKPVDAIAEQYLKEYGVAVRLQYGGTGTLLSQIRVAKSGDLFVAADAKAMEDAHKYNTVREVFPLVTQHPVIAVPKGNPKNIKTLNDLLRDDVRLALSNPEAASIGRITKKALGDKWEAISTHAKVMKPTVTEIASDLSLGAVDAAIIWDATVAQFKGITYVDVPELESHPSAAKLGVLEASKQPTAALKFARYLTAPEKGGAVFNKFGFKTSGGDKWAEKPEMILYSGGVNRPAVEKLLGEFADREGVNVTTVFNGCGILCASMKAMTNASNPKFPDAYYACDICFVPPVAQYFPEAVVLTKTDIGIAVRKGNPKGVKTLADLAKPGLRVGLCNAEQSTLGYMTRGILRSSGLLESIRKNVAVEVPTADFLINQMRAGALDAAIVYRVNAQLQAEHIEFMPIKHEGAHAMQPFAVRAGSKNTLLSERLLAFLQAHKDQFVDAGFTWNKDQTPIESAQIVVPDWLKTPAK